MGVLSSLARQVISAVNDSGEPWNFSAWMMRAPSGVPTKTTVPAFFSSRSRTKNAAP